MIAYFCWYDQESIAYINVLKNNFSCPVVFQANAIIITKTKKPMHSSVYPIFSLGRSNKKPDIQMSRLPWQTLHSLILLVCIVTQVTACKHHLYNHSVTKPLDNNTKAHFQCSVTVYKSKKRKWNICKLYMIGIIHMPLKLYPMAQCATI